MHLRTVIILLAAFAFLLPFASQSASGQSASAITPQSLKAEGLKNEELLLRLYVGDFSGIGLQGAGFRKSLMFMPYVQAYSKKCESYLPEDKISLTKQVCVRETVTTNGFGHVISRQCAEYETRSTGTYMHPRLQAAWTRAEGDAVAEVFQKSVRATQDMQTAMENMVDSFDDVEFGHSLQHDMYSLVGRHHCTSPELMHFEENLRLYALGARPVVLDYDDSLFAGPAPPPNPESVNYAALIEDLVREESRTWRMNRYVAKSTSNVTIGPRDQDGYPKNIRANYLFQGFGAKKHRGSVRISFASGVPECLYFFDFPQRCRKPQERIIESYSGGRYTSGPTGNAAPRSESTTPGSRSARHNRARSDKMRSKISSKIYVVVEEQPDCGGLSALQEAVVYPETARRQGIEGRVFVQFIVDENGAVGTPTVARGAHPLLDQAALEAVGRLSCTPGRQSGIPVKVKMALPVIFRL